MEPRFHDLWRDWHDDLIVFARHQLPKLLAILLIAFILIRLLGVVTRKLVEIGRRKSLHPTIRAQQVATLVGVIRSVGIFVILLVTLMQVLLVFDINVAPLLASAGIAGLAIGFGAQTLVKDVINGFFILAENQFEIGDTIKTAGVQGTVEEITMRRTVLRDSDGTVHIVPNSNMQIVSNTTRDWTQVSLHVSVAYSEDSDRVLEVLRETGQEFYDTSDLRDQLVAQPEIPGIERISGQEVDYLMLVKVRPGKQFEVARELRRRIKASFNKNKIKAGSPAQVYIGEMPAKSN